MSRRIVDTSEARKDAKRMAASGLKHKALGLLDILADDSYRTPAPFEKLVGDLRGAYSRRMNTQHRIVYEIEVGRGAGRGARPFGWACARRRDGVGDADGAVDAGVGRA